MAFQASASLRRDIVSVDCGCVYEGFVGDAAFTPPALARFPKDAQKLIDATEGALYNRYRENGCR